MALETGTFISDLVITNPASTDSKSEGDNHLRLIKSTIKSTFPNITGAVNATQAQLNSLILQPGQNKIINGNFDIWQRGTSFTLGTTAAYTADRWSARQATAAAGTVTRQATTGVSGAQYALRLQRNSGSTNVNTLSVGQVFESVDSRLFQGKTVTVSYLARAGANFSPSANTLGIRVRSGTGTDQGADAFHSGTWTDNSNIGVENKNLTTSWQQFTTIVSVPSNCNQLGVLFFCTPTGTAGVDDWFEVAQVQFEVGSVATPFEHRPYGMELALCQRYYQRIVGATGTPYGVGICNATTSAFVQVQFVNSMRVAPSALEQTGTASDYQVRSAAATTACSAVPTFSSATTDAALISATVASGLTVGDGALLRSNAASAYLGFSAEL